MKKRTHAARLLAAVAVLLLLIAGTGLYSAGRYISSHLLQSNENTAVDLALLVKNNFHITDEEVAYMKGLTFNEMEVDPINMRLMNVGDGIALHAGISNIYLVAPLAEDEYRYCPDQESADFLGFSMDTPLDGVWLLNGKINANGYLEITQRDDICRYTVLDVKQRAAMESQETFGDYSSDAWGSFITGYAPIYTEEGNFVGLLGIDMDPDQYQNSAERMMTLLIVLFALIICASTGIILYFSRRYGKLREQWREFDFYSRMSHQMRTPMNGILGMAAASREETDVKVLHRNFAEVERSGRYMLGLINDTLDYQKQGTECAAKEPVFADKTAGQPDIPAILKGKRILLCEDHPLNAEITNRQVSGAGCVMELAVNGQEGLEKFAASPAGYYDAILMDVRMPLMDGIEATRRIRALDRPDAKTVPILALTANSYDEDREITREAGMNAHLTKPVEPEALYRTLAATMAAAGKKPE